MEQILDMMNNRLHFICATIIAAVGAAPTCLADSAADQLRTQEARQEQVRSHTQQIAQQIDLVVSEFERNGMGEGQDVKTLRAIRAVLAQLSNEQMQRVILLLQQARSANDGGISDEKQAYLTQQGILAQFRELLDQYDKDKSVYELADRLDRLAKRQALNLSATVEVAQAAMGKRLDQLDPATLAAIETQQSEQISIASEVKDAQAVMKSVINDASGTDVDQLNKALARAQTTHLSATVLSAASDLQSADLFRAAGGEKDARDTLRDLTDLLSPPKGTLEIKKDQLATIESELEKQREIVDRTKSTVSDNATEAARRQTDRSEAASVDDTDQTRKKLANLSPAVADLVKQAESNMQQVRADIAQHHRDRAAEDGNAAADSLQLANDELQKEIAQGEADVANVAPSSSDKLAETKQLLGAVKQLRDEQQAMAGGTPATQPAVATAEDQRSLAEKAHDLQQQAAASAAAVADELGEASKQMAKASESMAHADRPSARSQQQAADTALAQAQDGLRQQTNNLQQAQDQLNQLQRAQQQIAALIQKQAAVALATAQQAGHATTQPVMKRPPQQANAPAQQPNATTQPSDAEAEQPRAAATQSQDQQHEQQAASQPANPAQQQQQIADQTVAAQAQVPASAQQAAAALGDAQQEMREASQNLQHNDAKGAQSAQGEAISDLGKAAVSLAGTMDQLKSQLGQPAGDPAAAQAAQDAINQAAQQLQKAQGQLDQAQLGAQSTDAAATEQAQKSLEAAAQSAAAAMGKNDSQSAVNAVQQAITQMNQAGQQIQVGHAGDAQQSTAAAQAALSRAKTALAADLPEAGNNQRPIPGQSPSQSQSQSSAQASAQTSRQTSAPSPPSDQAGAQAGMSPGNIGDKPGNRAAQDGGERSVTAGASAFVQLPPRDRQALQQSQAEKYPEEYGNMVEQYLRNLSDGDNK